MHTLLSTFSYITDIIFPRVCLACGMRGKLICLNCISNLPSTGKTEQSFITAIFDYNNQAIRSAIWKFKYKNARSVAELFGRVLYDEIIGDIGNDLRIKADENFLLVPVPLHKKRFHARGYNQSELLAREIIKYDTEKILTLSVDALTRSRKTLPQARSQKRAARFENLRGAFIANVDTVRSRHIILLDDVTTTGATLSEARKALIKAGAKSVRAYTVAH